MQPETGMRQETQGSGRNRRPMSPAYVSRKEALEILSVKPQTLYSYVSRGLIRRSHGTSGRASLYNYLDIRRLKSRSLARSGHGPAAANAIHWGEPVLTTGITEITPEGPRYRECLAIDLAEQNETFENIAEYLWTGERPARVVVWPEGDYRLLASQLNDVTKLHPSVHIRQLLTEVALLLGIEQSERASKGLATSELDQARLLILAMVGAFGIFGPERRYTAPRSGESVALGLARALGLRATRGILEALNAMLIIVADHEFSPATFAARIAASAGSDLYSCIGAALQVLFGSALGLRRELLDQHPGSIQDPFEALRAPTERRVAQHLIYPPYGEKDPRAAALSRIAARLRSGSLPSTSTPTQCNRSRASMLESRVMLDSIVAVCDALRTVPHAAGGLLALGRMAGWVAHVVEQRRDGLVIRPRAKFIPSDPGI